MTDILAAVDELKKHNVEAFEGRGMLVIPCNSPAEVLDVVTKAKSILKGIDYQKTWIVDPYYFEKNRRPDGSLVMEQEEFI